MNPQGKLRFFISIFAVIFGISFILYQVAQSKHDQRSAPHLPNRYKYDMALFNWISKVAVGSQELINNAELKLEGQISEKDFEAMSSGRFIEPYLIDKDPSQSKEVATAKLILAGHLISASSFQKVAESTDKQDPLAQYIIGFYAPEFLEQNKQFNYEEPLKLFPDLKDNLGWIAELFLSDLAMAKPSESAQDTRGDLFFYAKRKAIMFFFTIFISICAFGSGLVFLISFTWAAFTKRLVMHKKRNLIENNLLLEIFALYILAMGSVFWYGNNVQDLSPQQRLDLNLYATLSLVLLILWPLFNGEKLSELLDSLGLYVDNAWKAIKDVIYGPLFVFACWPLLGILGTLYQIILNMFNVDIEQGQHPVVPVFLASDNEAVISSLVLFAVVIAPIVEEIFFRGTLYTYLRTKFGIFISMILSGFIFAVIHPQGAVGILPLTLIGSGLAFLREWRGSLISSIFAHATVNGSIIFLILQLR